MNNCKHLAIANPRPTFLQILGAPTYINDPLSGTCLSPEIYLFSLHVLKPSLMEHNTNYCLEITTSGDLLLFFILRIEIRIKPKKIKSNITTDI